MELPHVPWQYMPNGQRYLTSTYPLGDTVEFWSADPGYALQGLQRLMLQVGYADQVLGEIVARLRRSGLYRRALVAVVADHGAAFIPSDSRRIVDANNAGWILRVPMFLKLPGQRQGRVLSRRVRSIDLLPTIADVLGIRIPWHVDGRSMFGRPSTTRRNTVMRYRKDLVHIPPAAVKKGFASALAVRNGFFGHGDIFTFGTPRRVLQHELSGARKLEISVDSPGGTTYDPASGVHPVAGLRQHPQPSAG